jgi:hypothetical protein
MLSLIRIGLGASHVEGSQNFLGGVSSGKNHICRYRAEAQKLGGTAAYIDMEHALDRRRITLPRNVDNLLIPSQLPRTGIGNPRKIGALRRC